MRLLLLVALPCVCAAAQQPAQQHPAQTAEPVDLDPDIPTLHVYSTHLQTAALVIDRNRQPVEVPLNGFLLSVDHGTPFAPLSVHREDNDPISLAVLIDLTVDRDLLKHLPKAIGGLREGPLGAQDRVNLFAVDCSVQRYPGDTTTAAGLVEGVESLLQNPALHPPEKPKETCSDSLQLWDAAAAALGILDPTPGRHVLLIVTGGGDAASQTSLDLLSEIGHRTATAIFLLPDPASFILSNTESPEQRAATTKRASDLALLTEKTGGIALVPPTGDFRLDGFISLVRSRYILEFARPKEFHNDRPHIIGATLGNGAQPLLITGTSAPVTNDQERRDANTVSYDGSAGGALGHEIGADAPTPVTALTSGGPVSVSSALAAIRVVNPDLPLAATPSAPQTQEKGPAKPVAALPCVDAMREGATIHFSASCEQPQRVLLYDGVEAKPEGIDVLPGKPVTRTLTQPDSANFFACPAATHPVNALGQPVKGTEQDYSCVAD